jgi:hypothetical protein
MNTTRLKIGRVVLLVLVLPVVNGDHCLFNLHKHVPLSPTGTEEKPDDAKNAVPRPRRHRLGDLAR